MRRLIPFNQTLTCFMLGVTLGCTEGIPTITALGDLDALQISTTDFQSRNLATLNMSLSGHAPGVVSSLEVSTDMGRTWTNLESLLGPGSVQFQNTNCKSNCPFSVSISNLSTRLTDLQNMVSNEKREILVRGQSLWGKTGPTSVFVTKIRAGYRVVSSWDASEAFRANAKTPSGSYVFSSSLQDVEPKSGSNEKGKGRTQ